MRIKQHRLIAFFWCNFFFFYFELFFFFQKSGFPFVIFLRLSFSYLLIGAKEINEKKKDTGFSLSIRDRNKCLCQGRILFGPSFERNFNLDIEKSPSPPRKKRKILLGKIMKIFLKTKMLLKFYKILLLIIY